jgi:hypothetical protein
MFALIRVRQNESEVVRKFSHAHHSTSVCSVKKKRREQKGFKTRSQKKKDFRLEFCANPIMLIIIVFCDVSKETLLEMSLVLPPFRH